MPHVVMVDGVQYIVERETHNRLVLRRLRGDLSDIRRMCGMTQAEMASRLGISQAHLCHIETGLATPSTSIVEKMEKIARHSTETRKVRVNHGHN